MLIDFTLPDYEVRRDIATRNIGAKMMIGYSLKEEQCNYCNMPVMIEEYTCMWK
jgi:hypothetical protein